MARRREWGAVNQSESGRGGQDPLTLCTVGGGIFNLGLSSTRYRHTHAQCAFAEERSGAKSLTLLKQQRLRAPVIRSGDAPAGFGRSHRPRVWGFQTMDCLVTPRHLNLELFSKDSTMAQ